MRRLAALETRVGKIEKTLDLNVLSRNLLIVGAVIFVASFIFDNPFIDLLKFLQLRAVGLVLLILGALLKISRSSAMQPDTIVRGSPPPVPRKEQAIAKTWQRAAAKRAAPVKDEVALRINAGKVKDHFSKYMPRKDKKSLETNIGTVWFTRIGVVSLVIGMIFFLKYAFDRDLIPPTGRVMIGVLAAVILVVLGEYFDRKKYLLYARGLTGGGFAVLYASVFAAYNFYELFPLIADLILLSAVVILAVIFAIKYNSGAIAWFAFLLGYLTAFLTGESNIHMLGYTTVLTAGLLILVYKKGWKYVGLSGLIATYLMHLIWLDENSGEHLTNLIFLTIYAILFGFMSLRLNKFVDSKKADEHKTIIKILMSAVFTISLLLSYIASPEHPTYLIFYLLFAISATSIIYRYQWNTFAAGAALATYISFIIWREQNNSDPNVTVLSAIFLTAYFLIYTILSFFTEGGKHRSVAGTVLLILISAFFFYGLAIADIEAKYDQFSGLFTLGLAAFYLAMSFIAKNLQRRVTFYTYLVLAITFLTLTIPIQLNNQWITISWAIETFLLLLLGIKLKDYILRILAYILASITFFKTVIMDSHMLQAFDWADPIGSTRLFVFALTIVLFYVGAYQLMKNKSMLRPSEMMMAPMVGIAATILTTLILILEGDRWSSILIAIQFFILLLIAIKSALTKLRYVAYGVAVVLFAKLLTADLFLRSFKFEDVLDSVRFFVFIFVIAIGYIAAILLSKISKTNFEQKYIPMAFHIASTIATTVIIALELEKEWMTVGWALQAIILLMVGFVYHMKLFRQMGILVFGLAIIKVVFVDFQELEMFFRIVSFIGLGIILLVAAYIYHRFEDRTK